MKDEARPEAMTGAGVFLGRKGSGRSRSDRRSVLELQERIEALRLNPWGGAMQTRELAIQARDEAVRIGSPVMEAEALLLLGRNFTPTVMPDEVFTGALRAQAIFQANDRRSSAAHCQVVAARALMDMGRDRDAIDYAEAALRLSELTSEHRTAALVIIALCHGHLGETEFALDLIAGHALPLAEAPGAAPQRPHVLRAAATLRLQLLLSRQAPFLWRGVPCAPPSECPKPHVDDILELVNEARAALPPGCTWPILEYAALVVTGFTSEPGPPLKKLEYLAATTREPDPPASCWAHFCAALVLQHSGRLAEALQALDAALGLASAWHLTLIVCDSLLQRARIYEELHDAANSLRSYQAFWAMRDRAMYRLPTLPNDGLSTCEVQIPGFEGFDRLALHSPEAACVRRARAHIEQNLGRKLLIAEIARDSGASRRTLELGFRNALQTTVAQYIKTRRLERASAMLNNTACSIKEVAHSVGYMTAASFGRDFLQQFGAPPAQWRRNSTGVSGVSITTSPTGKNR